MLQNDVMIAFCLSASLVLGFTKLDYSRFGVYFMENSMNSPPDFWGRRSEIRRCIQGIQSLWGIIIWLCKCLILQ